MVALQGAMIAGLDGIGEDGVADQLSGGAPIPAEGPLTHLPRQLRREKPEKASQAALTRRDKGSSEALR